MTNIETVISDFEGNLRQIGFCEATGAMLIQVNISGKTFVKSIGNLNHLSAPTVKLEGAGKDNLIEFICREIELSSNSKSTKKLHYDTVKLINHYTPEIAIQDVTSTYLQLLEQHMRTTNKLATNTIARHMKVLKKYINIARKKEIISKYPFLNYKIKTEQVNREALTEKELELLENYRNNLDHQSETLNGFLFSCYTGLRYSDICTFTKQKIVMLNRKRWAIVRMTKTKIDVRIPLSTIFGGKALRLTKSIARPRGILFQLSNNQQVNRELNRAAKACGIKKKFTFHTARHTCATLLLYRGVSITTVQTILGHKSVKTTQIYSAVTDLTMERELKKSNKKTIKK